MLKTQKILDFPFINSSMIKFVETVHERIIANKKTFIVTANPEIITYANSNSSYKQVLMDAEYIIPDGVGIIFASKFNKVPLVERLPGFELMEELLVLANRHKYSVYFLGAQPGVIDKTVDNILKLYPNINLAGYHHGYFRKNDTSIIDNMKQSNPDIIFLGLGFPKQENWIAENKHHFNKGVFIGLGGCFDIWGGVAKRAPKLWRNLNLEWCYRIVKEPTRIKRAIAIPKFVLKVIIFKIYSEKK